MIRMQKVLLYASAAATAIPGIIHLDLANQVITHVANFGIFFLVAGILQLFWVLPVIRQWHMGWYCVGIGGTIALIAIWSITRMPNTISGRALSVNELGIIEETLQIIFIGLSILVLGHMKSTQQSQIQK
ncbi:MAG: hypothetical protein ACREA7_07145 [Nitrosotalea sp.]